MANTQLLQLIKDGFAAMKTGSEMAAKATSEISDAARIALLDSRIWNDA